MTNAEKFKEVFEFELNTKTDYYCPFNSTKCDNLPCDACIETFWQSEYQDPNVQAERQKWIKAINDIQSGIEKERDGLYEMKANDYTRGYNEASLDALKFLKDYTKELIK